jgi:hypothetical protein
VIKKGCEALKAHPNWVMFQIDIANAFDTMWHKAIFHEF